MRVALTNIASGDAITDTNSQITKISNMLGGANMSEILKSVYVSREGVRYSSSSYNMYPDSVTAKAVNKAFGGLENDQMYTMFRAPEVSGYKFLTWELPRTSDTAVYAELEDGTNVALILANYSGTLNTIAIYVRA